MYVCSYIYIYIMTSTYVVYWFTCLTCLCITCHCSSMVMSPPAAPVLAGDMWGPPASEWFWPGIAAVFCGAKCGCEVGANGALKSWN